MELLCDKVFTLNSRINEIQYVFIEYFYLFMIKYYGIRDMYSCKNLTIYLEGDSAAILKFEEKKTDFKEFWITNPSNYRFKDIFSSLSDEHASMLDVYWKNFLEQLILQSYNMKIKMHIFYEDEQGEKLLNKDLNFIRLIDKFRKLVKIKNTDYEKSEEFRT